MVPFRSTRSAESYGLKVACTRPAIIEAQNWIFVNSLTPMIAKSIVLQVSLDSRYPKTAYNCDCLRLQVLVTVVSQSTIFVRFSNRLKMGMKIWSTI